jgi:MYXO-CTERM domain-containing protein
MRRILEGITFGLAFKDPLSPFKDPFANADIVLAPSRRRNALRTSFGAKRMNLTSTNTYACDATCSTTAVEDIALRMLGMSGPARIEISQESTPPTFDILTPTGTAYEIFTGNTNLVRLEFSTSSAYTSPTVLAVPVSPPTNNSPPGFFRYTLPNTTWNQLRDASQATSEDRLYYRVQLCNASGTTCWYSAQAGASFATFLQLGPGVGDNGCSCRVTGAPSTGELQWLASAALFGLVLACRRRR